MNQGDVAPSRRFFHLFVYGTLRSQGAASDLLSACERVESATVNGTLYDIDGAYPALVLAGSGTVHGEIWRCPVEVLQTLDRYEGTEERLFRRVGVQVGEYACWTYVAGPAIVGKLVPARRIESGVW